MTFLQIIGIYFIINSIIEFVMVLLLKEAIYNEDNRNIALIALFFLALPCLIFSFFNDLTLKITHIHKDRTHHRQFNYIDYSDFDNQI